MATNVEEDMHRSICIAGDQQGTAGLVMRYGHSRLGKQCGNAEHLREPIEQCRLFAREMVRASVVACRDLSDGLGTLGSAILDLPRKRELAVFAQLLALRSSAIPNPLIHG